MIQVNLCRLHYIVWQDSRPHPLRHLRFKSFGAEALVSSDKQPDKFPITDISNGLEALGNLIYLICEDADHPPRVRRYANMCEERLRVMTGLVDSMRG